MEGKSFPYYRFEALFDNKEVTMPEGYRRAGIGDVIAFLASLIGIHQLEHCGCTDRQAWLNRHFPLPFKVKKTGDPVLDRE